MKKLIYFLFIIVVSLFLFSCKSKDVVPEKENVTETVKETDNKKKPEEKESGKKTEKEKKPEEEKKVSKNSFIGWIDIGSKDLLVEDGIIRITTNSKLGTFCIYIVDPKRKAYPVLSTLNEYSSSGFHLKYGKDVYKLIADKRIKTYSEEVQNGLNIYYTIDNIADVIVNFQIFPSIEGRFSDTVKITADVRNIGKKAEVFGLKAILDTVLGENSNYHFYDCEDNPIKDGFFARDISKDKWFISRNDRASMQLLVNGGDTTKPEVFSMSNYVTLEKSKWVPSEQESSAFDNVLSYNNSAIGMYWADRKLEPDESYKITFYISGALGNSLPNGYLYVYGIEPPEPEIIPEEIEVVQEVKEPEVTNKTVDSSITDVKEVTRKSEKEAEIFIPEPVVPQSVKVTNTEKNSSSGIEFNLQNVSQEHLSPEYIQNLVDRIAELEATGSSANRSEILQLNAELDAILSILR